MTQHTDSILIIDFGSQVTQLIARRVREAGVYCEIHPSQTAQAALNKLNPKAIILSGGPASAQELTSPRIPDAAFALNVPMLGICYGQQALCHQLGGSVAPSDHREFGRAQLRIEKESPLFDGVWQQGGSATVWMSHGDRVTNLPDGFDVIATTNGAPFAAIGHDGRKIYGVQFHPEVVHTPDGAKLIKNFITKIVGLKSAWTMTAYRTQMIDKIKAQVGDRKVICGLSGGVDSSVAAVLIHEAIGDQLTCIYVDHGMMRAGESDEVVSLFQQHYKIKLVHVDASARFLSALENVTDPEVKRKTIGQLFIDVFEQEANKIGDVTFLAQGTLYPDVIESVSFTGGPSVTIKSHHNVGGLPERMNLQLVEPLRELFKDEVRALGCELGLSQAFIGRHPFPGPGLAVRCPGEITDGKLKILRAADKIYIDMLKSEGLYDKIWQAFAVLLPVKTVGVMGDGRTYEYVCGIRAVTSTDGMTADFYPFKMDFIGRVATKIINEVSGINRVVYDVTSKPPGTIEWE